MLTGNLNMSLSDMAAVPGLILVAVARLLRMSSILT